MGRVEVITGLILQQGANGSVYISIQVASSLLLYGCWLGFRLHNCM